MKRLMMVALVLVAGVACAQQNAAEPPAKDPISIGTRAPAFALVNAVDGAKVAMQPDDGKLKVVVFTCNQCPFAKAFEPRIIELANQFSQQGVVSTPSTRTTTRSTQKRPSPK